MVVKQLQSYTDYYMRKNEVERLYTSMMDIHSMLMLTMNLNSVGCLSFLYINNTEMSLCKSCDICSHTASKFIALYLQCGAKRTAPVYFIFAITLSKLTTVK